MVDLPVVVVVATHGDRLHLLIERALPSIAKQTTRVSQVIVVSDNEPMDDFLEIEDVLKCFDAKYQNHVSLVPNARTRGSSGTGAWNTGIYLALASYGEDCWVAILDDDDEWKEDHIETCLGAASKIESCQWVVSGLIRCSQSGCQHEPLPVSKPKACDFFATNPGIQGSNLFVRVRALLGAGLFDEYLPSTTDRDLCIRLCDLLSGSCDWFSSTGKHTVVHYADANRARVSSRGSPAKIQGLKRFFHKYAPRMSHLQRNEFKSRASNLFGCGKEEFNAICQNTRQEVQTSSLVTWSSDRLPLNVGTLEVLPKLQSVTSCTKHHRALFGIITSDLRRLEPLLDDLSAASKSQDSRFDPFVIVFVNCNSDELLQAVKNKIKDRALQGYVLSRSNPVVEAILCQCNDVKPFIAGGMKLPIAIARSVLQVFIYNIPNLDSVGAVVILDDDKRLPKGWSPFTALGAGEDDILIGRDLRTPPNPSIFSLRTNLIDLLHGLDLEHTDETDKDAIKRYCLAQSRLESGVFDWYYDLSSSRTDHLEIPVYSGIQIDCEDFADFLNKCLVGTPHARDVVPTESGPTLQRGGCMVIINKNSKSFEPLAVQQHAPPVTFSDGTTSYSRRSDQFWCKEMKKRGLRVVVDEQLFVYHDNRFDTILSPSDIRRTVVQEAVGGILCRDLRWRKEYKDTRLLQMRGWLIRVRGILTSFRNRPYCTDELISEFITPLESILEWEKWEAEVFFVIERAFDSSIQEYQPNPADFARMDTFPKLDMIEVKLIENQWYRSRIGKAYNALCEATGEDEIDFVGIGSEGVSFHVNGSLYKVFDLADSKLSEKSTKLLNASYLGCPGLPLILVRAYYPGEPYRGGYGMAMVKMLRKWKGMKLHHTNLTPDNLLINKKGNEETLTIVDIGRDVKYEPSAYLYQECFRDMCKRAFLCSQFGGYASNPHMLKQLKQWMREDEYLTSLRLIGFEAFMRLVYDSGQDMRLKEKLDDMNAVCTCVVSPIDEADAGVVERIAKSISQRVTDGCQRAAIVIEDPFHHMFDDEHGTKRRPMWFYRRHIRRLQNQHSFSLEEDSICSIDSNTYQEYVGFHIFVLDFQSIASSAGYSLTQDQGCFLMIKSCPLEFQTIVSDVRRTVFCLETSMSFKSIVLVADVSKVDGFIRQYASADIDAYKAALHEIEDERLVDCVAKFDGKDSSQVLTLNQTWLGRDCHATHSLQGQHYASTFFGFEEIKGLACYSTSDVVLQLDSDIIFHCDGNNGCISECIAVFDDPKVVSFAFPIASRRVPRFQVNHLNQECKPFRFEIRCSFVHLDRMVSMLPLLIPRHEVSTSGPCLERGWWHTLDHNVNRLNLKSCRGSVGNGNTFFVHPPNEFKGGKMVNKISVISGVLSGPQVYLKDLKKKSVWREQLNHVNLQSIGIGGWLQDRHESVVVAIDLSSSSFGSALHSFKSLSRIREKKMFQGCGVIAFDNGSSNIEDICCSVFRRGKEFFGANLTAIAWRKPLSALDLQVAVKAMCANANSLVFIQKGGCDFDLHRTVCLLPDQPLKYCSECGSYWDKMCECCDQQSYEFDFIPCTSLPCESYSKNFQLQNSKFFVSKAMTEGKLNIQITALVSGFDIINGAENVCVRIHSECLTGDVFYSMKCDCGVEKMQFMDIMAQEEKICRPSVLVYIRGHEGRGAGLFDKIRAYDYLDRNSSETHIDALHAIGCESDIRKYDAAVRFIKHKLQVRSIKLFTNNPEKIGVVEEYFGSNFTCKSMPAVPGNHNGKYLEEKFKLLGHEGLL